jgi:hypothetical protein
VKEAEVLLQPAEQANVVQAVTQATVFDDAVEPEAAETPFGPVDDLEIRVRYPENAAAIAAFGIENSGKETLDPIGTRSLRPPNPLADQVNAWTACRRDRLEFAMRARRGGELKRSRLDLHEIEIVPRPLERFTVCQCESEYVRARRIGRVRI